MTAARPSGNRFGRLTRPALLVWLLVVAWLTLRPDPAAAAAAAASPWWCLVCGPGGGADVLLNIVLFLPLGWLLVREGRSPLTALGAGVLLSISIELLQGTMVTGRDGALGDVVANGAGALVGAFLAGNAIRSALVRHRDRLAVPSLVVFALVLAASARLARPWLDVSPSVRVVVPPAFTGRPVYRGSTDAFALLRDSSGSPNGFLARFAWSPPDTDALTPILSLQDRSGFPVASVDRRGRRLGIELRLAAARWRLRTPSWTVPVPAAVRADDPLAMEAIAVRGGIGLTLKVNDTLVAERTVHLGATAGWALLNPFAPTGDGGAWHWWTFGWLAGWGGLLGWAARTHRRRHAWGLAAVGILIAACAMSGVPATAAQVIALAIGWLAGLSSRRFPRQPAVA